MKQDERTPRSLEQEPTRRISLFEEGGRTQRLELPPTPLWAAPAGGPEPRGKRVGRVKHGKHSKRFSRRWPIAAVVGLIGLMVGVVVTLLATRAMLQREIGGRDTRIMQLSSELGQARADQLTVSARRAELNQRGAELDQRGRDLDQRVAALDQREREFDQRVAALDQRERDLDRRKAVPERRVPRPDIALPDGKLDRDIFDRLGQRIQGLIDEAMPSKSGPGN